VQRTAGSAPARPRSRQALHVVVLGSYTRFPHGMATASRVRLVSRALVEAGDEVLVLCLQASERPPCIENTRLRGIHQGVAFEYTTWTTVRHDSFSMRRLIAAWGWAHGAWRLASLRYQGRLDLAYVWPDLVPSMRQVVGVGLLRLLGVPVVGELNERPWSLSHPRALGRFWSPLTGMSGVVSISGMLSAWARAEARRRHRDVEVIEVPILVDVEEQPVREYPVDDPPVVMFAGSPEYDETIKFILESMKQVWQKVPECRLVVTGANRGDPAARWLFLDEHRDPRVHVVGYVSRTELLELYGDARALLIPLFDDVRSTARFPTKIGEYLASGRPVVTTAVGEIPRYFHDGVDAVICPAGDPAAYADRIVAVLNDPGVAASIGRESRRLAASRFHYALYSETLHRGFASVASRTLSSDRTHGRA